MVKLPFVVQPKRKAIQERIGSEESGYIEIERRGYLTTGEKSFVQQALASDDSTINIISLARKISNDYNVKIEDGYNDVMQIISGLSRGDERLKKIEIENFSEFSELLSDLSRVQAKEELITAMAMLIYRVNADITIEDVMGYHPDIISDLAKLYKEEESRSIDKFVQAEQEQEQEEVIDIAEMEKKPSKRTARAG